MNPDFLAEELNRAKNRNLVFKSSTFVLEKNENSDLLSFSFHPPIVVVTGDG